MPLSVNGSKVYSVYCNGDPVYQFAANGNIIWKRSPRTIGVYVGGHYSTSYKLMTRVNINGALVSEESSLERDTQASAGASIGAYAGFASGRTSSYRGLFLVDSYGAITTTNAWGGTELRAVVPGASSLDAIGVWYGSTSFSSVDSVRRFDESGQLIGDVTYIGVPRGRSGGAQLGTTAGFYGGIDPADSVTPINSLVKVSSSGTLTGSVTNLGTARHYVYSANADIYGLYYGGSDGTGYVNTLTRIAPNGALVSAESSLSARRYNGAGASIGHLACFYAGYDTDITTYTNRLTKVDAYGTLIGADTFVGYARYQNSGAST